MHVFCFILVHACACVCYSLLVVVLGGGFLFFFLSGKYPLSLFLSFKQPDRTLVWVDLTVSTRRITYFKFPRVKNKVVILVIIFYPFPFISHQHLNETGSTTSRHDHTLVHYIETKKLLVLCHSLSLFFFFFLTWEYILFSLFLF